MATMAACLVYEGRGEESELEPKLPRGNFQEALAATEAVQEELYELQGEYRLPKEQRLQLDMAWGVYRWATGAKLQDALKDCERPTLENSTGSPRGFDCTLCVSN